MKDGALKDAVDARMAELGYPPVEPWAWLAMVGVERPESRPATEWLALVIETVFDCFADESPDTIVDLYSDWGGNDLAHEVADGAVPAYNAERVDLCASAGWYRVQDEGLVDVERMGSLPDLAGVILFEKARFAAWSTVRFVEDLGIKDVGTVNGAEVERAVAAADRAAELLEDALDELADAIRACGDSAGDALHGAGFFLPPEDVARVLTGSGLVIRWEVAS